MRIHQIVPGFSRGDAISNHILEMDNRFRQWQYNSQIFVQTPIRTSQQDPALQSYDSLKHYLDNRNDLFIYHYGIYHPSIEIFQKARGHKVLIYHNITPAHFFAGWDTHNENICNVGRTYLQYLLDCDFIIGDSNYNRSELVDLGFDKQNTAVLPIFLTLNTFETLAIDETLASSLKESGKTNWLTVGRIVPNKMLENIIRIFYIYNKYINPNSHLHLVGSSNLPAYREALTSLITELELTTHVSLPGKVSDAQLKTYYSVADLYVTASEHEGFCVPLIESMYFNLPILANNSSAIPETLGDAGILFSDLGYEEVASMAHLILTDNGLKESILTAQQQRLAKFTPKHVESTLREIINRFE